MAQSLAQSINVLLLYSINQQWRGYSTDTGPNLSRFFQAERYWGKAASSGGGAW